MTDNYSRIREAMAADEHAKWVADEANGYRTTGAALFLEAMQEIEAADISPVTAKMDIFTERNWKFKVVGANGTTISRDGDKPLATINQRFSLAIKFKARGGSFAACQTWHDVQNACKDDDPDEALKEAFKAFVKKANERQKADLLAFLG